MRDVIEGVAAWRRAEADQVGHVQVSPMACSPIPAQEHPALGTLLHTPLRLAPAGPRWRLLLLASLAARASHPPGGGAADRIALLAAGSLLLEFPAAGAAAAAVVVGRPPKGRRIQPACHSGQCKRLRLPSPARQAVVQAACPLRRLWQRPLAGRLQAAAGLGPWQSAAWHEEEQWGAGTRLRTFR